MAAPKKYDRTPIYEGSASIKDYVSTTGDVGPLALETTQRHIYGRRFITWDGKVFKYCKSAGTLYAGYGAANTANSTVARLINSVTPFAYSIGDRKIIITVAATEGQAGDGVVAENELDGAYVVLGHGGAALTENRTVMGNTAVASGGGTTTLTLDFPLGLDHAAGVACELPANPYRYLSKGAYEYNAFMCVPMIAVTSTYNFWGQTAGPCWVVPGGADASPGDTVNDRTAYFVGDGSVNFGTSLTVETGYQIAGYCIDTTASGTSAMPLIMLTLAW